MEIQWTADLATGIECLDRQHRELFDAANVLLRACSRGDAKARASETLRFLDNYITEHFETEEALMIATAYEGVEEHKRHHDEFRAALRGIQEEVAAVGVTTDVVVRINTLLIHWLGAHIRKVDHAMAEHVRMCAAEAEPALA